MALVPLTYTLRSTLVRLSSTLLTTCSIGATVAVLAGMLALEQGFATLFVARGRTDLAVFMRPGAQAEGESSLQRDRAAILIKETPEIATTSDGQPLASAELYLAVRREKIGGGESNIALRGVQPRTFDIHEHDLEIVDGRRFTPGTDEVIVGRPLVDRVANCRPGDVLQINTVPFRVVGVFDGMGGQNSEVWGDADRLMEALERPSFSRVIGVLRPGADVEALAARLKEDQRVPASVAIERDYLAAQTRELSGVFEFLGMFLAIVMGIGAVFTGTNAMLTQIVARTHEIGILSSVGFRPFAIFTAFLLESAVLGLLGGAVGCLLVLPLEGMATGTMNGATFTEATFAFRITWYVIAQSILFALILGLIGGAFPAWRAARLDATTALRRH